MASLVFGMTSQFNVDPDKSQYTPKTRNRRVTLLLYGHYTWLSAAKICVKFQSDRTILNTNMD